VRLRVIDANKCGNTQIGNPFPHSQDVSCADFVTSENVIEKVDQFANRKLAHYMYALSSYCRDINGPVPVRTIATGESLHRFTH
jgi:hypothetical protein